jgi:hypothetical protein
MAAKPQPGFLKSRATDAKASKGPSLALAAHSIAVAVEPVRVGWQDREVTAIDLIAV